MMRWMALAGGLAMLCACAPAPGVKPQTAERTGPWNFAEGRPPHLIAHYMPWFATPHGPSDDAWRHWEWSGQGARDPESRRADGRRDIASTVYPLIGPYDSSSPAVIRYHLATAKAAGIQGLALIWYGPMDEAIDARVALILDEALRQDMRIAICYEEKICFAPYRSPRSRDDIVAAAVSDLAYVLERYAKHPAYLRRDGRPFVFQFNYWGTGRLGPNNLTPDEWRQVFAQLAAKSDDTPILYGRQNLDEIYHPPIDAAYVWWSQDAAWLEGVARRAAELRDAGRLTFFMTMVSPGFDDTGVWGWGQGPRKSQRYGLDVLRQTWDLAWRNDPELIQIVTWNDFNEATVVEPTVEHGFEFLDAIETWLGQHTGRTVDLDDNRAPFEEYRRTCSDAQRAEIVAGDGWQP